MTRSNLTQLAFAAIVVALCTGCSESGSPTSPPGSSTTGGGALSDFHGDYTGSYRVSNCVTDGAAFAGFCEASNLAPGATLPITMSLAQTQSAVTGSVALGQITGTFQGTDSGGVLSGSAVMADLSNQGTTLTTTIPTWTTTISGNALSGGFGIVFRAAGTSGAVTITTTIVQLTR